jgi:hypothetical protein
MVEGILISVSQQELPENFATDTDTKVAELAKNFNATNSIKAPEVTAYIGTSAKGPQSVIFAKSGILVLIKSEKQISASAWSAYIETLK